jgi:NADPH:quinone reductase
MSPADGIPQTMRAAAIDRFGRPDVLSIHTVPVPDVSAKEVLIELDTAGVGSWDADMRGGWLPDGRRPRFPLVLGTDGAGVVVRIGSRVKQFTVGDAVYSYSFNPKGGFYAEYVAVAEQNVGAVPETLDLVHAGAIPTTGLTALQGIDDALRLKRGESLIIHGASGGVGTLAVQFAKLRGARVFATASGKDGTNLVRALGADVAVDGRRVNITAHARRFAPDGVDALLGFVGGKGLTQCLDATRRGGRFAFPNGIEPAPRKRHGITFIPYDAVANPRKFESLSHAVDEAKLEVVIADSFPLELAAAAHRRLAGHVTGKIVLRIKGRPQT